MDKYYCLDCKKETKGFGLRCKSCEAKRKYKMGILTNRGINNPSYIDNRTIEKHYCIDCKTNEISYPTWRYGKQHCQVCASKDTSKNLSHNFGKYGSNFIHGNGYAPYPLEFNDKLKESIRNRDNHTCQNCGMTEEEHLIVVGKVLTIHHIDYNKENCNKSNLITLCMKCNTKANANRDYWYAYFTYIMKNRYCLITV